MYVLDLNIQHTNMNSQSFQLKHAKAQFLIFAEANLPNCDLEFRRSAPYLKTPEEFREILQYWWETSSYSAAPDARKLSTIFIVKHLSNNMINKWRWTQEKIRLQNSDKCCPCCQSSSIWLILVEYDSVSGLDCSYKSSTSSYRVEFRKHPYLICTLLIMFLLWSNFLPASRDSRSLQIKEPGWCEIRHSSRRSTINQSSQPPSDPPSDLPQ